MPIDRLERTRRAYDHDFSRDRVDGRADRPSLPGGDREPGALFGKEAEVRLMEELYVRPACESLNARIKDRSLDADDVKILAALGWNVIEGDHFLTDRDPGDEA